jgi:hypothetical protein
MKRIILLVSLLSLFIIGCGTIVKKPDIFSVKKLAIISVYANNSIYNVKTQSGQSGVDLKALKSLVGKEDDIETDEITQIATAGLEAYVNTLKGLNQWVVADPKSILNHQAYKAFPGYRSLEYTPAYNMKLISFGDVADSGNKRWVNGKEVHEEARKSVADLCKALNVDGVAIIQFDLAYKPVFLSGMKGTGLFSGVKAPAEPSVSSAMIIITKNGTIAAQSDAIQRGGGSRSDGERVTMLHQGRVTLKAGDGEAVREYVKMVKMSAEDLKTKIQKELAAK